MAKGKKPKNRIDTKKYIEANLYIRTKDREIKLLKLNKAQLKYYRVINRLEKERKPIRVIILKARQMGFSTVTEAVIFKKTSTQFNTNSGIIAHKDDATTNLFNMSKLYYNMLQEDIKPELKASNAKELIFDNANSTGLRSKIKCMTAGGSGAGRSDTYDNLHISEYAFWAGEKKETLIGLLQSVPDKEGTMIVIESTANGYDHFKELWDMAVRGESDFVPIFAAWWEFDEYQRPYNGFEFSPKEKEIQEQFNLTNEQMAWRRWCIANNCGGDEELFRQEYPASPQEAFLSSGNCIFDQEMIYRRINELKGTKPFRGDFEYKIKTFDGVNDYRLEDTKFVPNKRGYIKIYQKPIKGEFYTIGGDTAGEGSDYFTAHVINNTTGEQVAVLKHKYDDDLYAKQLYCLGEYYNYALLAPEVNFSSYPIKELQKMHYPKLYIRQREDSYTGALMTTYGFKTTSINRSAMLAELVKLIRDVDTISLFNDTETLEEMLTFVRDEHGKAQAQTGCHDDLVIGLAIAHYVSPQQKKKTLPKPPPKKKPINFSWEAPKKDVLGRGEKINVI